MKIRKICFAAVLLTIILLIATAIGFIKYISPPMDEIESSHYPSELKRPLSFTSVNSITDVFKQHGHQAEAYHGSVDTLKRRLTEGNPIIVFIKIPADTHYAVVVGYDQQHIYLADFLAENVNALDERYNRVLTMEEFEDIWETSMFLPENIYICTMTHGI